MDTTSDWPKGLWLETERVEDKFERIQGHDSFVECCSFSSDGTLLVTCSGDKTLKVWNVANCSLIFTLQGHEGTVWSCEFHSDQTLICSCSSDKTVRLWSVGEKKEVTSMCKHKKTVWASKFCPGSNKTIVSCSSDMKILVWDYGKDFILREIEGHNNVVESICFSCLDGSILASCSRDKTVRLWKNYRTPFKLEAVVLTGHRGRVTCCEFSPSDDILASCSSDLTVRVWDTVTGNQLHVMYGHSNVIWKCTFTMYRRCIILASCSSDRTARIWDPVCGCELKKLKDLDSPLDPRAQLFCCAFSASSSSAESRLAVTSYEGQVYIAKLGDIIDDVVLNVLDS